MNKLQLKEDKKLAELQKQLSTYCHENNYSCVISVMHIDKPNEGTSFATNGDFQDIVLNLSTFASCVEKQVDIPLIEVLAEIFNSLPGGDHDD